MAAQVLLPHRLSPANGRPRAPHFPLPACASTWALSGCCPYPAWAWVDLVGGAGRSGGCGRTWQAAGPLTPALKPGQAPPAPSPRQAPGSKPFWGSERNLGLQAESLAHPKVRTRRGNSEEGWPADTLTRVPRLLPSALAFTRCRRLGATGTSVTSLLPLRPLPPSSSSPPNPPGAAPTPRSAHFNEARGEEICSPRGRAGLPAQGWSLSGTGPLLSTPHPPGLFLPWLPDLSQPGAAGPVVRAPPRVGLRPVSGNSTFSGRIRWSPGGRGLAPGLRAAAPQDASGRPACPASSRPCRDLAGGRCTPGSQAAGGETLHPR